MAPKRLLKHAPPADSSSEEEPDSVENEEEEEEQENGNKNGIPEGQKSADDHDTEDEEQPEKVKPPVIVKKPKVSRPNDESGSDSETESDKTPPSPSPTVSKPVDGESSKPKKKPPARPSNKRESEPSEKDEKEKKKRKVGFNGGGDDEDTKKASGVTRLWSDDDEVALLKGMTDYKAKKGTDPNADVGAFRDFIKERLSIEVSKSQLGEKIRRLKKKYQNNAAKGENGEDPVFSKTHDSRSFQLSKKVWGKKSSGNGSIVEDKDSKSKDKERKKKEKVQADGKLKAEKGEDDEDKDEDEDEDAEDEEEDQKELAEKYPFLYKFLRSGSFSSENEHLVSVMEKFMPLMESSHLKDLEEKLKKLQIEEMELHLRRTKLIYEQEKLVLGNIKNM